MHSIAKILAHLPVKSVAAVALGMLISESALTKDFYRWTDENGTTHYSSHPPSDKPSAKVRTTNIKVSPREAQQEESVEETEKPERTNFDESANAPETKEQIAQRKENCKRAKFNLKTLKEKPRIRVKEGDDYRYISQKERKQKIKDSEKAVKQYCKK